MKKYRALLAAALAAMTLLTGCTTSASPHSLDEEYHCAVCLGSHLNAPVVNLALVEDEIYRACITGGSVSLIVVDGQPFPVHIDIPAPEPGLSEAKYKQIASQYTAQILDTASKLCAQTEEVDTIQAVQLASRALQSADSETGKPLVRELIVIDSCLSTQGAISFVGSDIAKLDPAQITAQLRQMDAIPDLEGLEVFVYSLGDVAGEQAPLGLQERKNLQAIWEAILTEGGANVSMRADLPLSIAYDESLLPSVSEVEVQTESVDLTEAEKAGLELESEGQLVFGDEVISFEPGSAVLKDPEEAAKQLAPTAEYLSGSDEVVLICGTTACWGGESYCLNLSKDRGNTIRDVLVDLGVDASRMEVVPLGYSYPPFYTDDQNSDGTLNGKIAPENRKVHLVLRSSELGQDILDHVK